MNDNKKIQELRKEKKIPQKKVAIDLGMSQGALSKIENGHIKLKETTMQKLADSLGVTPEEIKEFTGKNIAINIEVDGDNSGNNGNVNLDQVKLYEQMLQDKERIIEAKDVALEAKDATIALQAKIIELLEKEK